MNKYRVHRDAGYVTVHGEGLSAEEEVCNNEYSYIHVKYEDNSDIPF